MLRMFDALVRPILCYGCEVWGVDFGMQVRQYLEPGAGAAVPFKTDEHEPRGAELLHKKSAGNLSKHTRYGDLWGSCQTPIGIL
jgi:hypothetical protein